MPINVLRLRMLAANCRGFAAVARNDHARRYLSDLAREYDARAADVQAFDEDCRKPAGLLQLAI